VGCKHELPGLLQLANAEQNMSIRFNSHTDPGTRVCEVNAMELSINNQQDATWKRNLLFHLFIKSC